MDKYQLPPGKVHKWKVIWTGQLYGHEYRPERANIFVTAQTAHMARHQGSLLFGVAPEHLRVELEDNDESPSKHMEKRK
jgi:hypothetical protein